MAEKETNPTVRLTSTETSENTSSNTSVEDTCDSQDYSEESNSEVSTNRKCIDVLSCDLQTSKNNRQSIWTSNSLNNKDDILASTFKRDFKFFNQNTFKSDSRNMAENQIADQNNAYFDNSKMAYIQRLNFLLKNPSESNIFSLFEKDGFIRLNMIYISPLALKHFREKLKQYGLIEWTFNEDELVFKLADQIIKFSGDLKITGLEKIFSVELDFDPVISKNSAVEFLNDVETFLKKCDACFFMTYPINIDSEILRQPLVRSLEYLISRK